MRAFNNKEIKSSRLRVKHIASNKGHLLEDMVNTWLSENDVTIISIDHVTREIDPAGDYLYYLIKYLI
jgi:hypothetical protein